MSVAGKERVTSFKICENICFDREVLKLAIRVRSDIRAGEPDNSSNSYIVCGNIEKWGEVAEEFYICVLFSPSGVTSLPLMVFTSDIGDFTVHIMSGHLKCGTIHVHMLYILGKGKRNKPEGV